jgi:hypothetical protein
MQRWIAAGLVVMLLFLGGSYYGYKTYKQNRPHPVWVPLPIRADLESKERDKVINQLKEKLDDRELLLQVSKDVGLAKKWKLASDEAGADEIAARLFVKSGDADTPMGKVPAILIGVKGKNKESVVSGELAMRLMDDVWKILGITPPKKTDP